MTFNAGVWIDHHKAVVVLMSEGGEGTLQIMSDRDLPSRSLGGKRVTSSYTPNDFVAEDKRERKATRGLNKFYDDVIACLREAEVILVMGPGEAKLEFTKRIERKAPRGRVAHVAAADKMTNREIAAHVRRHFAAAPQKSNGDRRENSTNSLLRDAPGAEPRPAAPRAEPKEKPQGESAGAPQREFDDQPKGRSKGAPKGKEKNKP
jgi:hypothetical protein